MGCRSSRSLCGGLAWRRRGEGAEACLSRGLTVMHLEVGACGWQMKRDQWKVRFEVECGSDSNAALPSHLSITKPPGIMKAAVINGL